MRLIEKQHCWLYEGVFPGDIVAGFTKPSVEGRSPAEDAARAVSFLERPVDVSFMKQVHGADVHNISGKGVYVGDGLITGEKGLLLAVKTADCMPLLLYSRLSRIAAAVHMGWRSAREGILSNLKEELSSFAAVLGPGLRKCCYEVGPEFLDHAGMKPFIGERGGRLYFDPVSFVRDELTKKGLGRENLFDTGVCSYCSPEGLHSFRRTGTKSRTISFIMM